MATTIETKKTQINKLLTDAQAILIKEGLDSEQRSSAKKMLADADALQTELQDLKRVEAMQAEMRSFEPSPRPQVGAKTETRSADEIKKEFSSALRTAALRGMHVLNSEQRDLLTTGSSGAVIPQGFLPTLIAAQKYYGPIAQEVSQKITNNNGAPIKVSLVNDTQNGFTVIGEGTPVVESDPTFQPRILGTDTVHSGLVKISWQELEDSAFDMENFISTAFGGRYGRSLEKAVTLGTDINGGALSNSSGLVNVAVVGQTTKTLAAGLGYDDFVATYYSLDPAYRTNGKWVMNSSTQGTIAGVLDQYGRPLFQPDPATSEPFAFLLGKPVLIDQAMPNTGAGAVPVLFGDLKQSYLLRTDGAPEMVTLRERYADTLETGFFMYNRIGGISLAAGQAPLASLKQAAS